MCRKIRTTLSGTKHFDYQDSKPEYPAPSLVTIQAPNSVLHLNAIFKR